MNMPIFLSSDQLHFHTTPQFRLWLISFSWGQGSWRRTGVLSHSELLLSPSPWWKPKRIFLDTCYRNLVKLLEVNLTILSGPPYYGDLLIMGSPWRFLLSDLFTLTLQQFISYSSSFTTPSTGFLRRFSCSCPWVSAPVSCISLCLPVGLSSFGSSHLPCVFPHASKKR